MLNYEWVPAGYELHFRTHSPNADVVAWIETADESLLFLSVLTLGEIRKGITLLPQGRRRTRSETWLDVELRARFDGRIVPIDEAVAERWGLLAAAAKRKGQAVATIDGLRAATAPQHSLTIVSRNVDDSAVLQVAFMNPWRAA